MTDDSILRLAILLDSNPGAYALLVGSGLSSAARIPTGWEIVRELARRLATLENEDPNPDPETWYQQKYGEAVDYSRLFARLTSTATERMNLLRPFFEPSEEEREQGFKVPTKAHQAIAALTRLGYIRMILTTNFDRLLQTALEAENIVPDVVSSDDTLAGAIPYVHSQCSIIKLNGDYKDTRIKNTPEELANYSTQMNAQLDRILDEFGLIVCGWSGVWDIALRNAILRSPNRRFATFWLAKGELTDEAKQVIQHRHADVIAIENADQFFTSLLEKILALRDIGNRSPLSTAVAVATVKRYLTEPQHRIRLDDLVREETLKTCQQLSDRRFNSSGGTPPNAESFQLRMHQYENIVEKLMAMMAAIGFYDKGDYTHLFTRSIDLLVQSKQQDGFTALVDLQYYPALLVSYASGIAAIANSHFDALSAILRQPSLRESTYGPKLAAVARFNSSRVFRHSDKSIPRPNAKNEFTPENDYLYDLMRTGLSDYLPEERKFEENFDLFEYLVSLTYLDLVENRAPFGRFAWRYKAGFLENREWVKCPLGEFILNEIKRESESSLLKAGFFNGDATRLKEVVDLQRTLVAEIVQRWR